MCIFHKYRYMGHTTVWKWLGGVKGGLPYETMIEAKKCTKCGKVKEI